MPPQASSEAVPVSQNRSDTPHVATALLRHVVETLADGIVVGDLEGTCLLANATARRLLGVDRASQLTAGLRSALGCFLPDMVTPCPPTDQPFARALQGEVVSDFELFLLRDGSQEGVWLSVDATPIRDVQEKIEGAVLIFRDLTLIKKRIQQIELLSSVVEATADAVIVTDRAGRIEYVNPAFETATGYTRAEALGRNPSILKSGAHPVEFYGELWKALVDGRVFRGTFVNRKKSGELFFTEQTITPIRRPGGGTTHVVSVGKDVTQLRRAAERESALLLARSVQQRLFPPGAPVVPGYDIYGATYVADVTGGDYYDFIPLLGDRQGLLVGDVSGHGVDSALLMAETRAVLRATALTTTEPSEILAVVSRVLHADTEAHRFATLLLVSLDPASGMLAYSSAGHPSGYLFDQSGAVKSALPATGVPLGLFPDARYETRSDMLLEPGDTLVLLTDGVTDSGVVEDELFGPQRALDVIRASLGERSSDIVEDLYRATRAFENGRPQTDDITIMVVKRTSGPRP
jgi:sigma-B regulation protein RsbU (phosphoserine phosphatase)